MLKFPVHIQELDQLPTEKSEALLKECMESSEFARRTRRVRIVSFVGYAILLIAPPCLVQGPVAKSQTQAFIYIALALVGLAIVMIAVPLYFHPRILRRLIREKLRNIS